MLYLLILKIVKHLIIIDYDSILHINLNKSDKYVALSNLGMYCTWKNFKKPYKNNKFRILAPTWNEEFELPGRSYSALDI